MKISKKIIIGVLITGFIYPVFALAAPSVQDILPEKSVDTLDNFNNSAAPAASALATGDLKDSVLPQAVKMFLGVVATISFVMFLYAGVNLVVAQGNEEDIKKFKTLLMWSVIGLLCVTMSFAIVKGVLQINFLT